MKIIWYGSALLLLAALTLCIRTSVEGDATGILYKEITYGLPAFLPCTFTRGSTGRDQTPSIQWSFTSDTHDLSSQDLLVYKGAVSEEYNEIFAFEPPANLWIYKASFERTGYYECVVDIPGDGSSKAAYNITVVEPNEEVY